MIVTALQALGQDPTFVNGGVIAQLGTSSATGSDDLFVIEAGQHGDGIRIDGGSQGSDAGVHAGQVVEPRGREQLLVQPEARRRLGDERAEVVSTDVRPVEPCASCHLVDDVGVRP